MKSASTPSLQANIQVDPRVGFAPHLADAFVAAYGTGSGFVTAATDLLTWRFVRVLVKSGKLPDGFEAPQLGPPELRGALAELITALSSSGQERPAVLLMSSAVGRATPLQFQEAASVVLGEDTVAAWLTSLERRDYAGANALLKSH